MNKLYTSLSGHPTCEVVLNFNENRKFFCAGDDLRGKVCIKTTVEGQQIVHQGIKVSLLGMILQVPSQSYLAKKNDEGFLINNNSQRG